MHRDGADLEPETIIIESQGGIGNQLFIYAFARELKQRSEFPVAIDLWRHHLPRARPFQISDIVGSHVSLLDSLDWVIPGICGSVGRLRHWSQKLSTQLALSGRIIQEPSLSFTPALLCPPPGTRLTGYFQSFKYFTGTADVLKQEMLVARQEGLGDFIQSQPESTAVHVRLGDFLDKRHSGTHATLTSAYYTSALASVGLTALPPGTTIFSDEPEVARVLLLESFPDSDLQLHQSKGSDLLDMFDMSTFDRIICANSSFSWWAAWLSGLPGDRIIVPLAWVNRSDFAPRDLFPLDWTVVSNGFAGDVD